MLYSYYAVSGFGYESVSKSFMFIGQTLLEFVSGPYLLVCVAVVAAGWLFRLVASGWFYRRLPAREIWGSLAGSLWLATATFLFLGLSRQIGSARHAVFPGIILMLVGCFWSWRSRPPDKDAWQLVCKDPMLGRTVCHFFLAFGMLLFFLSATFAFDAAKKGFALAANQTPRELQEKALFDELADKMKLFPRDYVWGVYCDEALPCWRLDHLPLGMNKKIQRSFSFAHALDSFPFDNRLPRLYQVLVSPLAFVRPKLLTVSLAGICALDMFATAGCVVYPARPVAVVRPGPVVVRPGPVVVRPWWGYRRYPYRRYPYRRWY
jgi:hypothetical protein